MFQFKKFSIDDSNAAMKVGTDAVMLGAWIPCKNETRILDIGTGTGILALMLAQRNEDIPVDAVEIDYVTATLASENIKLSPWSAQIRVYNTSFQEYIKVTIQKYSLVICNPPFFSDSLKAPDKARNLARHNDALPVADLLKCTSGLLAGEGKAAFIIPADTFGKWKDEASKFNLFPTQVCWVKSSDTHKAHRAMVTFTSSEVSIITENEITIYMSRSKYSKEYMELTKDFYLNF